MKYISVIIAVLMLNVSCISQKRCFQKFPPGRDTIKTETIKRDTIKLPGDTVNLSAPINCPDQDLLTIENNLLKQQLVIKNGRIYSFTYIKPKLVPFSFIDKQTLIKQTPLPVKYTPKLIKGLAWIGATCILIFIILILWKIFKPKLI